MTLVSRQQTWVDFAQGVRAAEDGIFGVLDEVCNCT